MAYKKKTNGYTVNPATIHPWNEVQIQFHMDHKFLKQSGKHNEKPRTIPSADSYGNLNTSARLRRWKEKHSGTPMFTLIKHCRWDGLWIPESDVLPCGSKQSCRIWLSVVGGMDYGFQKVMASIRLLAVLQDFLRKTILSETSH